MKWQLEVRNDYPFILWVGDTDVVNGEPTTYRYMDHPVYQYIRGRPVLSFNNKVFKGRLKLGREYE